MIANILTRLNWIDFIVLSVLIRVLYVGGKNGFIVELFKLIGITFTTYVSLHYYVKFSDFIVQRLPKMQVPMEFVHFLVFILLVAVSYSIFVLVRRAFCNLVKMEAAPVLSKWGGVFLGIGRGILTSSLVIIVLLMSIFPYLNASVRKSYSGRPLFSVAAGTYSVIWNGFMSKFMAGEKFNDAISKIPSGESAKK